MSTSNLLRLTDDFDDPKSDLRSALSQATRAARRVLEEAVDRSPMRDVGRLLLKPPVKVVDTDNMVKVTVELSEAQRELVAVTLDAHCVLHLRARPKSPATSKANGKGAPNSPGSSRPIERNVVLPSAIVRELATATLDGGRLTITIPKKKTVLTDEKEVSADTRAA